MKGIGIVMGHTIREAVRKKVFVVTNIIFALLIIIAFNIPNIISVAKGFGIGGGDAPDAEPAIVFISHQDMFDEALLLDYAPNARLWDGEALDELKEQVAAGELSGVVVVNSIHAGNDLTFHYYHSGSYDTESESIATFLSVIKELTLLRQAGVSEEVLGAALFRVQGGSESVGGGGMLDAVGLASILPMASSLFLFMMIFIYGAQVSASISSEKTSRVMETLITSTSPTAIVLGKTFANGILSLMQAGGFILVAVISYHLFLPAEYKILGMLMAGTQVSPVILLVILIYFVLGYLLFSMFSAVMGATVSRVEDVSAANAPLSILGVVSFYAAYFTSLAPGTPAHVVVTMIPFTSAFSMPGRMLVSVVPLWQVLLSIGLLAAATAFVAYLSIRIYAALILHYGNRLKIKDLFALYKQR